VVHRTQSVFRTQANVHESLGIPMAKIRAVSRGSGADSAASPEAMVQPIAVALAMKTGRPVADRAQPGRGHDRNDARAIRSNRIRTGGQRDGTSSLRAIRDLVRCRRLMPTTLPR